MYVVDRYHPTPLLPLRWGNSPPILCRKSCIVFINNNLNFKVMEGKVMSLKSFCEAHGGKKGELIKIAQLPNQDFVSIKTIDDCCFLAFARTQFPDDMSVANVKKTIKTKDLDVIEGTATESGKTCFTIIEHQDDLYEAFDF